MKDARGMYWRASSSVGRLLPKPKVDMVGDYAVVSLKDIFLFAIASGLKFTLVEEELHTTAVHSYLESRAGNTVRQRMKKEPQHGDAYPLQLAMYGWRDDCMPAALKQRSSVKVSALQLGKQNCRRVRCIRWIVSSRMRPAS